MNNNVMKTVINCLDDKNIFKYRLLLILVIIFWSIFAHAGTKNPELMPIQEKIAKLEKSFDGKIGVYAIDTSNNQIVSYRTDERFPVQSTMKLIGVAALLKKSEHDKNLLQEKIYYTQDDLIPWHPITGKYVNGGMTFEALAEAAMSYSDNCAINLIEKKLGGPKSVTDFAHYIGDEKFNVEHYDGNLNANPKNIQDTSTPKNMAINVQKLLLGNILTQTQQRKLMTWMINNTTGYKRIRAGVPIGWVVAEKTGGGLGGHYGIANDIGILWSPLCKPIVLSIYTVRNKQDAKSQDDIVASTTKIVLDEFEKNNECFKELFS